MFLDALRGIAALGVAWLHFYHLTPLSEPLSRVFPAPLRWFCENGGLGVQIFFVLSGFVIAYSIRNSVVTPAFFGRFALRRSIRLDPPYWFTILLAVAIMYASTVLLRDPVPPPSFSTIAAHFFYLQNILGMRNIVSQFWTLAYEVQFYLVLVLLYGAAERFGARGEADRRYSWAAAGVYGPLFALSVVVALAGWSSHGWFIDRWYQFFIGSITFWALEQRLPPAFWYSSAVSIVAVAVIHPSSGAVAVVGTAAALYAVGRLGRLRSWLDWAWLQYLGRISYSLYLIHFVGSTICKLGATITGGSAAGAVSWFLLATAVSLAGAELMYRLIERPSIRLTKRFKASPA